VAIAVGGAHTCGITAAGGVKCWGWNWYGQLGDGTTVDRLAPVDVSGLSSGVVALAAGGAHTCALTGAGAVKCWGNNAIGQLGVGDMSDRPTPTDVNGLSSGVVALAAGAIHTCAITAQGLKCWGWNLRGQLGDGTKVNRSRPAPVLGLGSPAVAIATGTAHTCALTIAGGVQCWGAGDDGQIGDGLSIDRLTPKQVLGLVSGISMVTAGDFHSCALTTAGTVSCWGLNTHGQLGNGTTVRSAVPDGVTALGNGAVLLDAGGRHTFAIRSGGGVVEAWGSNFYGELGDGTTVNRWTPVEVRF
jgi:alpha-tubulin suppressor-like RCC1 family protein